MLLRRSGLACGWQEAGGEGKPGGGRRRRRTSAVPPFPGAGRRVCGRSALLGRTGLLPPGALQRLHRAGLRRRFSTADRGGGAGRCGGVVVCVKVSTADSGRRPPLRSAPQAAPGVSARWRDKAGGVQHRGERRRAPCAEAGVPQRPAAPRLPPGCPPRRAPAVPHGEEPSPFGRRRCWLVPGQDRRRKQLRVSPRQLRMRRGRN